jgi:hypothetical protein
MPLQNLLFAFATFGLVAETGGGDTIGGVAGGAGKSSCSHGYKIGNWNYGIFWQPEHCACADISIISRAYITPAREKFLSKIQSVACTSLQSPNVENFL